MRCAAVVLVVLMLAGCTSATSMSEFESFKLTHKKSYVSKTEEAKRFQIFTENMKTAKKMQALNPHATFGASPYADMTSEEFKTRHNGDRYYAAEKTREKTVHMLAEQDVKAAAGGAIDWRTKGAVTSIKNQGQCGSCWSFSAAQNIEGQWFLAGNKLVSLAEQELVSCDHVDSACQGGLMDNAWSWLLANRNGTITSYNDYPYVSGDGVVPACRTGLPAAAQIAGHKDIAHDETQMAAQVLKGGPLSIGVDASSWQTYTGGIMTNCQSTQVDHGVLAVGYDDTNSPPYWIVKNSWGPTWGESGYIRVEKGTNQCLITSAPCTSIASKAPLPPTPPTPPGPAPTMPPAPPAPTNGTFTQFTCPDGFCLGCTAHTLPTGQCLRLEGQSQESVKASCTKGGKYLTLQVYSGSADCQGAFQTSTQPLDQCLKGQNNEYIYDVCGTASPSAKVDATRKYQLPTAVRNQLKQN